MHFLDVKTSYAFTKVFGSEQSKGILIDFLNAIIDFEDNSRILDLSIVDPYQIPLIQGMKDSYVDVKAVLSNKIKVIIEMQVLNYEGLEKRILYNAAKSYSTQLVKAQKYESLEPIITLTITDFILFEEFKKIISYFGVLEKKEFTKFSNDIELIFVELPKFNKKEDELKTITDKWIYFIKNAGELDYIPESLKESNLIDAFEFADTAFLSEKELEIQFKQEDFIYIRKGSIAKIRKDNFRIGRAEGKEEGREIAKIEAAQRSLALGLDIGIISKITGLTENIIRKISKDQS